MIPNRYWGKKWYLTRPHYKTVFDYLISQAKHENNKTDELAVGQCSIGTVQLSKLFDIPQPTIHRILQYLQTEGEISLKPTNKYTIVTINYLFTSEFQNEKVNNKTQKMNNKSVESEYQNTIGTTDESIRYESEVKNMNNKNEKMNNKTQKMNTPIDTIDIIDSNLTENKFSVNETKFNKTDMSSKPKQTEPKQTKTKVTPLFDEIIDIGNIVVPLPEEPKPKKPNVPMILLNIWSEEYMLNRNMQFPVVFGRDVKGCKNLLENYYLQEPGADLEQTKEHFRSWFKLVLNIKDQFIYKKAAPQFIYSELPQINTILNGALPKKQKTNSSLGNEPTAPDYNYRIK